MEILDNIVLSDTNTKEFELIEHLNNQTNNLWSNFGNGLRSFFTGLLPFGNLIDNGIGLISGISNNIYDRQLQERLFERDDTSLDRTMEMYKRNGINPLLALPNANVGNTRGPEPANISSDFNQSILNSFQRKQLKLSEEKMWLENAISREDLEDRKLTNAMNRHLLQGDINANWVNWKDYYSSQEKYEDVPYKNGGVRSLPGTEKEHLVRYILNLLGLTSSNDDGSSFESSSTENMTNAEKQSYKRDLINDNAMNYVANGQFTKTGFNKYNYRYQIGDTTFKIFIKPDGMVEVVTPRVNGKYNSHDFISIEKAMNFCQDFVRSN